LRNIIFWCFFFIFTAASQVSKSSDISRRNVVTSESMENWTNISQTQISH